MAIQAVTFNQLGKDGRRFTHWNLMFSTFCFLTSTTLFLLLLFLPPSDRVCIDRSISFKRAAEALKYKWVNFGDEFYPSSVYRHASPERDPAWETLMSRVSESELTAPHQSQDREWKRLADGSFAAVLGIHHQMNCLNLLRRHAHLDLDDSTRGLLRVDVDQCIELLRYQLMCTGDITPFLELSVPTFAGSRPDLRTMHKCRQYDDLKVWARQNAQETFHAEWDTKA